MAKKLSSNNKLFHLHKLHYLQWGFHPPSLGLWEFGPRGVAHRGKGSWMMTVGAQV